jgi:hypothetical protein
MRQREVSGVYNPAWPTGVHEELQNLAEPIQLLDELSDHFRATGNTMVANKLGIAAGMIYRSKENIRRAVSEKCDADMKTAVQSSKNMLAAGMAGVELGRRKDAKKV